MFCPSCGASLAEGLKYCNRCGSQLVFPRDTELAKLFEERMDSEMEGLFWITVLGIALILGGMVLMKKFQFDLWMIVAYLALSSSAFITYFGIGVWQVRRLAKSSTESNEVRLERRETQELYPDRSVAELASFSSVTEHTTRTLSPVEKEINRTKPTPPVS